MLKYVPNTNEVAELKVARAKAWSLLDDAADLIGPGMNEEAARKVLMDLFAKAGVTKHWHAPKIRLGTETTKGFSEKADQAVKLASDDILFIDIGPVFGNFEADVGDTYVRGDRKEFVLLKSAAKEIFEEAATAWKERDLNGTDLYRFASERAQARGLVLESQKAGGHIIAEFPHALHYQGSMDEYGSRAVDGAWVLEIQLSLPGKPYGAFYEDLLIRE